MTNALQKGCLCITFAVASIAGMGFTQKDPAKEIEAAHKKKVIELVKKEQENRNQRKASGFVKDEKSRYLVDQLRVEHEKIVSEMSEENVDYRYKKQRLTLQKVVDKAKTPEAKKAGEDALRMLDEARKLEVDLLKLETDKKIQRISGPAKKPA